jgi:hypothetical protein
MYNNLNDAAGDQSVASKRSYLGLLSTPASMWNRLAWYSFPRGERDGFYRRGFENCIRITNRWS